MRFSGATHLQVYVRSERAGQRVMESVSDFITRRFKLRVNAAKSKVASASACEFLGFTFTHGQARKRTIGPKALCRLKDRIRELTRRTRGTSIQQVVANLARYLRGWMAYFGFSETVRPLEDLDSWIRRHQHQGHAYGGRAHMEICSRVCMSSQECRRV